MCAGQLRNIKHLSNGPIKDVSCVFVGRDGEDGRMDVLQSAAEGLKVY